MKKIVAGGMLSALVLLGSTWAIAQDRTPDRSGQGRWTDVVQDGETGTVGAPIYASPNLGMSVGKVANFTTYATRAEFNTAFPGQPVEDFVSDSLGSGDVALCLDLVNSTTSGPCFHPGELLPGVDYTHSGPAEAFLIGIGTGVVGGVSNAIGPSFFVDDMILNFNPPVEAAALDVGAFDGGGTFDIVVFDGQGDSVSTTFNPGVGAYMFYGVSSPDLISQIKVSDNAHAESAELIDNVAFAAPPETPTLDSPSNGAVNVPLNTDLEWSPKARTARSHVQVATDQAFNNVVFSDNTTESTIAFSTSQTATTFWWRVQAEGAGGARSDFSASFRFTTLPPPPEAPALVSPADEALDVTMTTDLEWSESEHADEYRVQVATDQAFNNVVFDQNTAGTEVSFSTQLAGTSFWWRVKAIGPGGESAYSDSFKFTTLIPAPSIPVLTAPSNGAVDVPLTTDLRWSASTNADQYRIQVATNQSFNNVVFDRDTTATTMPFSTDLAGTTFWWRVRAEGPGGMSAFSAPFRFTTLNPVPTTPELLSPPDSAVEIPTTTQLEWVESMYANRYQVQVATDETFSNLAHNENVPGTRITFVGGQNGETFFWRVSAQGPGGASPFSEPFRFTNVNVEPGAVTLVSPADGATGVETTLSLEWAAAENVDYYRVEVATDSSMQDVVHSDSTTALTSTFIAGEAGRMYYWRVRATSPGGLQNISEIRDFATGNTGPLVPRDLVPEDSAQGVSVDPLMSWSAPEGDAAVSYHLQLGTNETFDTLIVDVDSIEATSYQVTGLEHLTRYCWRLAGVDADGNETFSLTQTFTTEGGVLGPVRLVTPADSAQGVSVSAQFAWIELDEATAYHIQVSTTDDFSRKSASGPREVAVIVVEDSTRTTGLFTTPVPLANGTVHVWRVRARNEQGWGEWSEVWQFTTVTGVATESEDVPGEFALAQNYPNPFNPVTTIEYALPEAVHVRLVVFDMLGRPVESLVDERAAAGSHRAVWNGLGLGSGVYYYRIEAGEYAETRRMTLLK